MLLQRLKPYQTGFYLYGGLFVLLLLLVPAAGFSYDVTLWGRWATHLLERGLPYAYDFDADDYNPFYQYILWVFAELCGRPETILRYLHQLKGFTLVFDFAGALLVAALPRGLDPARRLLLPLVLLLNLGYLYNTLIWEQVDAILAFWLLASVVLGLRGRPALSVAAYVLAYATKVQAIVLLPLVGLLWLAPCVRAPRHLLTCTGALVATAGLVVLPFWWGGGLPRLVQLNLSVASYFQVVSLSAANFWVLVLPDPATSDLLTYGPLTYRQWGMALFAAASALALLPVLALLTRAALRRAPDAKWALSADEQALVLLAAGLLPLFFTYFNTQMHERYWHPALLPVAGYCVLRGRYGLLALLSVVYLLQLDAMLQYLPFGHRAVLFKPWFLAWAFAICWGWGLVALYAQAARAGAWQLHAAWQAR